MIFKAEFAVELLSWHVGAFHLKVLGVNVEIGAGINYELHGLRPYALLTLISQHEEFIDEGIAPVKFQTVAERDSDIADSLIIAIHQPYAPQRGIKHKARQGSAGRRFLKEVVIDSVKLAHELYEEIYIGLVCEAKNWFHKPFLYALLLLLLL